MKKLLLIVPLVLIVAWAAATFIIGRSVEAGLADFYKKAESGLGSGAQSPVSFDSSEFKGGFLSSQAATKMSFNEFPLSEFDVTLNSRIYHGPLMFTPDGVKFGCSYAVTTPDLSALPADSVKVIDEAFDGEEPLTISTLTGFGGGVDVDMRMPALRHKFEDMDGSETKVAFAGFHGEVHGSNDPNGTAEGSMEIGELKVSNEEQGKSVTTAVGSGKFSATDVRDGVVIGAIGSALLPEIKMTGDFGEVAVKDVAFKTESSMDDSDNSVNGMLRMEFASVTGTDNSGMGQGLLDQLGKGGHLEFAMKGWDYDALMKLNEASNKLSAAQNEMMQSMMGGFSMELDENGEPTEKEDQADGEEVDMDKVMADMEAAGKDMFHSFLALLKPGMSMNWRLMLGEGEGRGEILMALSYADGAKPGADAKTVGELVNALVLKIDTRLAKALLPEGLGEAMLAPQVEQGMVEDRGDYYRATANLKGGKISVNGTELPIMEQFAPLMEQELSPDALIGSLMGGMGGGMGEPDMGGQGFDLPADADAASPDLLKVTPEPAPAPAPEATPVPQ